jgi:hypothetical protein
MIARTVTILTTLAMLGCNSGDSSTAADSATDNNRDHAQGVESIQATADIQAPDGLSFTSAARIAMALDLSDYPQSKAYLSVYSQYQQTGQGQWQIDYNSRVLGRSLTQQRVEQQLTVAQHIPSLLVVVWFYDQTIAPLMYEIQVAEHRI